MFSTPTDGVTWTAPQGLNGTVHADGITQNGPPYASGGVNMTTSPVCNAAYVAWTGPDGNDIYVARTADGQNWTYAGPLVNAPWPSGYTSPGTSSPALYGGNSQPIIQFAYPVPDGISEQPDEMGSEQTIGYTIETGQFNCDLSGVQLEGDNSCFLYDYADSSCRADDPSLDIPTALEFDEGMLQDETPSGPWSPVWGGRYGIEIKAISQGNSLNNAEPPTYFSINGGPYGTSGALQCLTSPSKGCPPSTYDGDASHWANNGGSVTVVPSSGTPFLAITCAPVSDGADDNVCEGPNSIFCLCNGGQEPNLQTYDLVNGYITGSANWSPVAPAAVYFDNQIWFAMCAGYSCEGGITVGSVYPAQLTGCTYAAPDLYVPGSATTATGTVDAYGSKGGCIWGAFSGPAWPWPALAAHGNGTGTCQFPVSQNYSAAPLQYSLTAADDRTVTVYQGTAGGSPGTGSVDIRYNRQRPGPDTGTVSVTVNGVTYSASYDMPGETAEEVAGDLASEINSQPPDSIISASVSGSTVYIASNLNGANTNYSFSASQTFSGDGPSFTAVCSGSPTCSGLTLTGGTN